MKFKNLNYVHKGALIGGVIGLFLGLTTNLFPPNLSRAVVVLSSIFWGFALGTITGWIIGKIKSKNIK